jgi:oxygen-independent coproporphyrinogen-3 oxidase
MDAQPLFDPALLTRYDRPGPRYTSYPTAPHFGTHFTEQMLREYLARSNADPIPRRLSLYLHVPYCFSPCFYCGCNRIITRDLSKGGTYVARLVREIELLGRLIDRDREVIQLHFGGGTPNFLSPDLLREVTDSLQSNFQLTRCKCCARPSTCDARSRDDSSRRRRARDYGPSQACSPSRSS